MKSSLSTCAAACVGWWLTAALSFATGAGKDWMWRNPTVQGAPLYSVTGTGTQVVAVGGGGTIVATDDGTHWSTRSSGVTRSLYGIAYGRGTYVAVGQDGTIVTSADAVTWSVRPSDTGLPLNAVAYGNNLFVAVGAQSTVVTSPDGIVWTKRPVIAQHTYYTVAWSGESFIAFDGTACLASPDGITWRTIDLTASNLEGGALSSLKSIAFGAGTWVVAGRDLDANQRGLAGFYTSSDAAQWASQRITTAADPAAIIFDGRQFVAVGTSGVVLTSPDGRTWTTRSASTSDTLYGVYWSGTRYYAVGDGGRIYVSTDAATWAFAQNSASVTSSHLRAVIWTGSQFLAAGTGGVVARSADGATWQVATIEGNPSLNAIACHDSVYVVVGDNGKVFSSTDAVTWTAQTSRTTDRLIGVAWAKNNFVAVGQNAALLLSSDAITWSDYHIPCNGTFSSLGISKAGVLMLVGTRIDYVKGPTDYVPVSHPAAYTSTNGGLNWDVALDTTSIGTLTGVGCGNEFWVAVENGAWVGYWSLVARSGFGSPARAVAFGSGDWIAVGGGGGIFTTTDPNGSWTRRASGTDADLMSVASNGTRFVAVGNTGTILSSDAETPPIITSQTGGATVNLGWIASFGVVATGAEPLTYSWSRNGQVIPGATRATLDLDNVSPSDAGSYVCTVRNVAGTVVSNPATLSINPTQGTGPQVTVQPLSVNAAEGGTIALNVGATGTGSLLFQWFRDGRAIAGGTGAQLLVTQPGTYTVRVGNAGGAVTSSAAVVTLTAGLSRLSNLSVRTLLKADQLLIVGATTNQAKSVLFRAVGPGLSPYGVSNYCPDPRAELYSAATRTAANDNWGGTQELRDAFVRTGAFALPNNSNDAAILSTVNGSCTAQIRGGGDGLLMLEMYDAGSGMGARLTNASTRSFAGTKENMLIAGFVIDGPVAKTLLIRGIGPTLQTFGVPGVLADPRLQVCDQGGNVLAENNDWNGVDAVAAAFTTTGAFPLPADSKDGAMLLTVPPGLYTVQVSGADGGTGEALIEIYEVP